MPDATIRYKEAIATCQTLSNKTSVAFVATQAHRSGIRECGVARMY
jgi:hypothetical protein